MSAVGQREIQTQRRVVAFFQDVLDYKYLGHWQDRPGNRNVERAYYRLTQVPEAQRQDHRQGAV